MKRLTTSALAIVFASGFSGMALADTHMEREMGTYSGVVENELGNRFIRAENIIGAQIYTQYMEYEEDLWNDTDYYETLDTDWENIGEISDIVLSRNGEIVGVIAEVGGWLDIGDEHVVIDIDDLKTVGEPVNNQWGDLSFVTPLSEEQLEQRREVDSGWW